MVRTQFSFKVFQDAETVVVDLTAVVAQFASVPAGVATLAAVLYAAAIRGDVSKLSQIRSDAQALFASAVADYAAAAPLIGRFNADLDALIADLTP